MSVPTQSNELQNFSAEHLLKSATAAGIAWNKTDVPGSEYLLVCSERQLKVFLQLIVNQYI